jgi:choline dehydrogenase-like flavoprotein
LANRLAASARKPSVLLVEAGGDGANIEYRNPYERFSNQLIPDLDYSYKTEPQEALGGGQFDYYRGRGLGGTSLTNFLVWSIGSSADYDRWGELVGDQDWAWKNTQQRFREVSLSVSPLGVSLTVRKD